MTELRVVRAEGSATERGTVIGQELSDLIERSLVFYHRYFDRRGVASPVLQDLLAPYMDEAERATPEYVETIKAMAEGATVPVWELFAVNAFEELEPLLEPTAEAPLFLRSKGGHVPVPTPEHGQERCSTLTVTGPGYTLLGHNEHWLAGDAGNVAVVIERPSEGTAIASPTVVCCLPAVGMNEHGGAQGIQSLSANDDDAGVPRVLVSRLALESSGRQDAMRRTGLPTRAGGYGHSFAFAGGDAFTIETTRTDLAVLDGSGPHTNHYQDERLAQSGAAPSEGSRVRLEHLHELLRTGRPRTPEGVMEVLRDHESSPQSICLHSDQGEGEEASTVVFSMVCDLEQRRMWVAPGNPCQEPYQEVDLSGVV
jgi:isopenicillin-N N-acyltransferase like protein